MDWIRISDSEIKIMLTQEELWEYELTVEELDYAQEDTRRMFRSVLHRVERMTDFHTEGYRILVQLYGSRDGGCELFVTRLAEVQDGEEEGGAGEEVEALLRRLQAEREERREKVFSFSALQELIQACVMLAKRSCAAHSAVYYGESGRYYLLLDIEESDTQSLNACRFLGEYGKEEEQTVRTCLIEHGVLICARDAIGIFQAL